MIDKNEKLKKSRASNEYLIWSNCVRRILTVYWQEVPDFLNRKDEKIQQMKLILLPGRFVQ